MQKGMGDDEDEVNMKWGRKDDDEDEIRMIWNWKHISKDDRGSWEEKEGEGEDEKETGGGRCQEGCC